MGIDNIEVFAQSSDIFQFATGLSVRIAARRFYEQGVAIRIIENGRIGFSCGTSNTNLREMIKNGALQARALNSKNKTSDISFLAGKEMRQKSSNLSSVLSTSREELETITNQMTESANLDPLANTMESSTTRHVEQRLILNSEGLIRESLDGWIKASVQVVVRRPTGEMGYGLEHQRAQDINSVDPRSVGSKAYASAMLLSNGTLVPQREQDRLRKSRRILWHPDAFAELLAHILVPAIIRLNQACTGSEQENNSNGFVFPETFDVLDDPTNSNLIPTYSFDDEGVRTRKKTLLSGGILVSKLTGYIPHISSSGGNCYRVQYFSEYSRSFRYPPTPSPVNLLLKYTGSSYSTNLVDQCAGTTILIRRVVGAHAASPTTGDFSVDVSEGYLVGDRLIRLPIRKISIAGNIYHLLKATRTVGITETVRPRLSPFAVSCPFILTEKSGTIFFSS